MLIPGLGKHRGARGGAARELRATFHPAVWSQHFIKDAVSRRPLIEPGKDPSDGIGAQPNKRLKLAAPVVTGCRDAFPFR